MNWLVRVLFIFVLNFIFIKAYEYDQIINRILQLSKNEDYLHQLESVVYQCHSNLTNVHHEDCQLANYLFHQQYFHNHTSYISRPTIRNLKIEKIDINSTPFPTIYEDYILKARPFSGKCKECIVNDKISIDHKHFSVLKSVHSHENQELQDDNKDIHDQTPQNSFSMLNINTDEYKEYFVPYLASLNILPRLIESSHRALIDAVFTTNNCFNQPCSIELKPQSASPLYQCPAFAHQLIWVHRGRFQVRLFDSKTSSNLNPSVTLSPTQSTSFAHSISYTQDGFSEATSPYLTLQTSEPMSNHEFLFVPNNYLTSFLAIDDQQSNENSVEQSSELHFLCIVDPSNINAFRYYLSIHESVSEAHNILIKDFLSGSSLDTPALSIPIQPRELTFFDYIHGRSLNPNENTVNEDTNTANSNSPSSGAGRNRRKQKKDFKNWQETINWKTLIDGLTLPSLLMTPTIGTIDRNSVSLQWSQLFFPLESDQTYFGFHLQVCRVLSNQWAIFDDKLSLNFNSNLNISNSKLLSLPTNNNNDNKDLFECEEKHIKYPNVDNLTRQTIQKLTFNGLSTSSAVEWSNFEWFVRDLEPNSYYQFKLSLVYGAKTTPFSPWTQRIQTLPLTVPSQPENVTIFTPQTTISDISISPDKLHLETFSVLSILLSFVPPVDNGGLPITSYAVYTKIEDKYFPQDWQFHGQFKAQLKEKEDDKKINIRVTNLQSNINYQFKIAAYNSLGLSNFSEPSESFRLLINPQDELFCKYFLFGQQHKGQYGDGFALSENPISQSLTNDLFVRLHLRSNQIEVINALDNIQGTAKEIWRSNWSQSCGYFTALPYFHESLELTSLLSSTYTTDPYKKIVFIRRGYNNLALYELTLEAQKLGALAVVIVDKNNNPLCDLYSQRCIPGSDKNYGIGFAAQDPPLNWNLIKIPSLFIKSSFFNDIYNTFTSNKNQHSEL